MKQLFLTLFLSVSIYASQNFDASLFEKAKKEHKFIVMDLEAVWCHWCHVMNKTTYKDEEVIKLLNKHFILVKVDHDARPDLAQRYREYGWPATIFFDENGVEIVKRSGYISPDNMRHLLQAIVDDPSPEENNKKKLSKNSSYQLTPTLKKELIKRHNEIFDTEQGGLKLAQKYLEIDSIEYAMYKASLGDTSQKERSLQTLSAAMKLIDPVWGGAYQYSTHGGWEHPHYEKIMRVQARYIKTYAIAAQQFNSKRYLTASKAVTKYVFRFLRDPKTGAFYVSQDADLIQGKKAHDYFSYDNKTRLKLGIPKVDTNLYAASQGDMIEALSYLYQSSHDKKYLDAAIKSLNWTLQNRLIKGGGFKHDEHNSSLFLDDNIKMAKALLALYTVTKNKRWLHQVSFLATFIEKNFTDKTSGVLTSTDNGTPIKPIKQIDENIQTVLFLHKFSKATKNPTKKEHYIRFTHHIMNYLTHEDIALSRTTEAGVLLCNEKLF